MNKSDTLVSPNPSERITNQIEELNDWRGRMLARLRELVLEAAPDMTEEWKWETAVWSRKGLVCSAGIFKDHVKLNFFKGALLKDPQKLFNAGLEAKVTRAIDIFASDTLDTFALYDLVRAAVAYNMAAETRPRKQEPHPLKITDTD
jgi:hypothetical protein